MPPLLPLFFEAIAIRILKQFSPNDVPEVGFSESNEIKFANSDFKEGNFLISRLISFENLDVGKIL